MTRLLVPVAFFVLVLASACATAPAVNTPAPAPTSASVPTAAAVPTTESAPTAANAPTVQNAPTLSSSSTSSASDGAASELNIKGNEFAFIAPDQVSSGWTTVTFSNVGTQPHQANLARLQEGKTIQELATALQQGAGPALSMLTFVGGPNTIDPGMSQQTIVNLTPGQYVLLCFVPDKDGVPHLAKGMVKPLRVVDSGNNAGTEPKADMDVSLKDFAFSLPQTIKAGQQTWKVTNLGPQPHELSLAKLADGKTAQDFTTFMQKPTGQPPFQDLGGIGALSPNDSGYVVLNLQPGNYVVFCMVTDVSTGKPHLEEGMFQTLTVQ